MVDPVQFFLSCGLITMRNLVAVSRSRLERLCRRFLIFLVDAGTTSLAVRTVSDWNQLPTVVVEQENPAAFKVQPARCAPVRMP